jgi:hypothetical protein
MVPVLTAIAGLVLGAVAGFLYRKSVAAGNAQSIEARAQKMLLEAEREADGASKRALAEVRDEIAALRRAAENDITSSATCEPSWRRPPSCTERSWRRSLGSRHPRRETSSWPR